MKVVSAEMAIRNIDSYLRNSSAYPFFVVVDGSAEYAEIIGKFSKLRSIIISSYCKADSFPDYDALIDHLNNSESDSILLGIGECAWLSGNVDILAKLKDKCFPSKLVIVCRNSRYAIEDLARSDGKFTNRRYCIVNSNCDYSVIKVYSAVGFEAKVNFQELIKCLESGARGKIYFESSLPLKNLAVICNAYEAIKEIDYSFSIPESTLSNELWMEYLVDKKLDGYDLLHWRTYLFYKIASPKGNYLKKVILASDTYDDYRKKLFDTILDYSYKDPNFAVLYMERKELIRDIAESNMERFIIAAAIKDADRIFYLTDITSVEKYAIIEELSNRSNIPNEIAIIYPALYEYLHDYNFTCKNAEVFNPYFSEYKRLKLSNKIPKEFLDKVYSLANDGSRAYNVLEARGNIVDQLKGNNTALYWVDALGVEFLGYIQQRAKSLGLKINIHIGRAQLPTLTFLNKNFYDDWDGIKEQTKELDKLKHEGNSLFIFDDKRKFPIYIAEELRILDSILLRVKSILSSYIADKVIIASDHGASRLAVIHETENKWEMATKGEHSGRCCPVNEIDERPECATEEHDFWTLANYDRFKGGRKACVEVHGGAALEEVLVPVIEVELKDSKIEIKNANKDGVAFASFNESPEIILFSTNSFSDLKIRFRGKCYKAEQLKENKLKYKVVIDDFNKAGKYTAEVMDGDNLIEKIEFTIQRRSGRTNDDDWFN